MSLMKLKPSAQHASSRPFHALGDAGECRRHVCFFQADGRRFLAVLSGAVLTIVDEEGVAVDVPRIVSETRLTRSLAWGGSRLLLAPRTLIDLRDAEATELEPTFQPLCLSPSGEHVAGLDTLSRSVYVYRTTGAGESYAPPVRQGVRVLAVTDNGNVLFQEVTGKASARLLRYRFASDDVEELDSSCGRSSEYLVSPGGEHAAIVSNVSVRLLPVGSVRGEQTLRVPVSATLLTSRGDLFVGTSSGELYHVRPDGEVRVEAIGEWIHAVAMAEDGEHIAVGTSSAHVRVLEASALEAKGRRGAGRKGRPKKAPRECAEPDAMRVERGEVQVASAAGRVVTSGVDRESWAERVAPGSATGRNILAPGPIVACIGGAEVAWRGAREGGVPLPPSNESSRTHYWSWEGVASEVSAELAIWQKPHPVQATSAPPEDAYGRLLVVDLERNLAADSPLHGPAAFCATRTLVGCILDRSSKTVRVARWHGDDGRPEELAELPWSQPIRVAVRGAAWAMSNASGETFFQRDPSAPRKTIVHRAPPASNPHASYPSPPDWLWMGADFLLVVRGADIGLAFDGALVEVFDLESAERRAAFALPHPSRAYAANGYNFWYARQDGELECIDLRSGERSRGGVPLASP